MKILLPILLIIIVVGGIFYFKSSKEKNVLETDSSTNKDTPGQDVPKDIEGSFVFDTKESTAKWTGSKKIIKDYFDSGSISIKSGNVSFEKGDIKNGEIVFDMKSISGESTSNTKAPVLKLTQHLKSADFFDVEIYPEAKYVVTSSEKTADGYTLKGNLTLKGKTNPLDIPVKTVFENGNVTLSGTVEINRSIWEVKYGSESFFDDLGDNVINDIFTLEFDIVARP
jgi:polyisoprenoid-binding protein YceI